MKQRGRKGIRPHVWKVQGVVPHEQYIAWQKSKAQANFRGELWMLSFEEYQQLWQGYWQMRGRGNGDWCLTREDPEGAWIMGNAVCMPRVDHLRRQRQFRKLKEMA